MAYVYIHKKQTDGTVFYVGIGGGSYAFRSRYRCYRTDGRSKFWKRTAQKYGLEVEIIVNDISWEDACQIEISLIEKYKKIKDGGTLVNITNGGDGQLGLKRVPWNKGLKMVGVSPLLGSKRSDETKKACSEGQKRRLRDHPHSRLNKKHSASSREKMSMIKIGKKLPESTCLSIRNSRVRTKVALIRNGITEIIFESIFDAHKHTGISKGCISLFINNKQKMSKKYDYELKRI